MPNIKSAKKELRKSKKLQLHNKRVKDKAKSLIKKSWQAIDASDSKAKDLVKDALKALDKAAQKGIIKKNTRDRKKSRLHHKLNQAQKKK